MKYLQAILIISVGTRTTNTLRKHKEFYFGVQQLKILLRVDMLRRQDRCDFLNEINAFIR